MFNKKVVVITGGSSGLGLSMAHILQKKGAKLILVSRDTKKLENAKKEIESAESDRETVQIFACDVADKTRVRDTFKAISESVEHPDILINSAGVLNEGCFTDLAVDTFRFVMDINFYGTLHCIQEVLPGMRKKGAGQILNICSVAGRMGVYGYAAYCASKHAVMGLTKSLRCELDGTGVSLHIAFPPEFDSPMVEELNSCRTPENRKMVQTIPVMGVEKVANLIIRGLEKNLFEIIPGLPSRVVCSFNQHFPDFAHRAAMSRIRGCKS
jgi:3-dehydrosphinganine reductase